MIDPPVAVSIIETVPRLLRSPQFRHFRVLRARLFHESTFILKVFRESTRPLGTRWHKQNERMDSREYFDSRIRELACSIPF